MYTEEQIAALENQIAALDDHTFYTLLDIFIEDGIRRRQKRIVTVLLLVGDFHWDIDLPGNTTIDSMKRHIECQFFKSDGNRIPGPSSRWIYKLKSHFEARDEIEPDPSKPLLFYCSSDGMLRFIVSPPPLIE